MTAAVDHGVVGPVVGRASHLLREVPLHVLMIGVMVVSMLQSSPVISVLGAAVLLGASVVCAALSRSRQHLREHVLDLWAMALVLVVFLPSSTGSTSDHSHVLSVPSMVLFGLIATLWALARVWLVLGQKTWRTAVISGGVTAVGLAVMAAFCR